MSKSEKIELIKRLISRGEKLCAVVLCNDWGFDYETIEKLKD